MWRKKSPNRIIFLFFFHGFITNGRNSNHRNVLHTPNIPISIYIQTSGRVQSEFGLSWGLCAIAKIPIKVMAIVQRFVALGAFFNQLD